MDGFVAWPDILTTYARAVRCEIYADFKFKKLGLCAMGDTAH